MTELSLVLVPALATALLQFLWQGTLVGLLAWLALGVLRNARPQARYAVACIALLACALLPAWHLLYALAPAHGVRDVLFSADAADLAAWTLPDAARATMPVPSAAAQGWIVAAWSCIALLLSLRLACGTWWVRRLCQGTHAAADTGPWQTCVDRLAPLFGIARPVRVRHVESGDSPMTAGWWTPVVLLPTAVIARIPTPLLEALIAHELAHVRRHDYLVNLLQGMVEALLFYHPVVWWLSHRIRIERELVADDIATQVLGDRRRLAVALSELDRLGTAAAPFPQVRCAQAARGGHLMSRIRRLVRPERRSIAGAIGFPLLGLAVAGVAFLAHARIADADAPLASAVPSLPVAQTSAAAPAAPTAPPTSDTAPAPAPAASAPRRRDEQSYAVVREGRKGFTMSGDMRDIEDIRAVQRSLDGDFVWFRRDGRAWVIRDAATLAQVESSRRSTDALDAQMQSLEERMRPHSDRMEALGRQMEALQAGIEGEPADMRAAERRLGALSRDIEALAAREQALARQYERSGPDPERQRALDTRMQALHAEQAALQAEMERHHRVVQAAARRVEAQHQPMEALAREMEAAGRPMEEIGRQMEALGTRIERESMRAHAQILDAIDDAWRRGLASPAPARQ